MPNSKRFHLIFVVGLLLLASLACEFSAGNVNSGVPTVAGVTTCKAVDADQKCTESANVFEPTEKIYVSVQLANMAKDHRVTARWFQGTNQIQEFTLPMEQVGSGYVSFSLTSEQPFPPGEYSAQILLNDGLAQTAKFQIAGEPAASATPTEEPTALPTEEAPPATAERVVQSVTTCLSVNADSKCEDQTTTFGPEDTLYASVEIVNAPAGMVITARWLRGSESVGETPYPLKEGGSGFIEFHLTPEAPFPPGPYAVEIYQDEALVEHIGLMVEGAVKTTTTPTGSDTETPDWQTYDSETWLLSVDYPAGWEVKDEKDYLAFLGTGKTVFYLVGYPAEGAAEESTRNAAQKALDNLSKQFGDFKSTELEVFNIGGVEGLTSDYSYTDSGGDALYGSVIAATSASGNIYVIYIEALAQDYEAALNDLNPMLQSLTFK